MEGHSTLKWSASGAAAASSAPGELLVVIDFDCTLTLLHMHETLNGDDGQTALHKDPAAFYLEVFGGSERLEKLRAFLTGLRDAGATVYLLSNGYETDLDPALEATDLHDLFDRIIGFDSINAVACVDKTAMLVQFAVELAGGRASGACRDARRGDVGAAPAPAHRWFGSWSARVAAHRAIDELFASVFCAWVGLTRAGRLPSGVTQILYADDNRGNFPGEGDTQIGDTWKLAVTSGSQLAVRVRARAARPMTGARHAPNPLPPAPRRFPRLRLLAFSRAVRAPLLSRPRRLIGARCSVVRRAGAASGAGGVASGREAERHGPRCGSNGRHAGARAQRDRDMSARQGAHSQMLCGGGAHAAYMTA
eukprot:170167-Prymnesium_polylepis.1